MSNIESKLAGLRKKIPGWHNEKGFVNTFGPTPEERADITPMTKWQTRILAEVLYAVRLSAELNGKYDSVIDEALTFLDNAFTADGTLTNSACERAEQMILPASEDAKSYDLILAGHAHIDMNWMWSYDETVASTIATFTTMLKIMDEYPQFCFSQSQTAVYEIIDKFAPELKEAMMKRIKEGRWEITSSAWVETDKNMPNTESLLRHIKYTKNYLRDNWDINPDDLEIDFSPDTFGHSANIPEIDLYGGVKYFYHCRGLDTPHALYRWKGQSGKEILCYREQYWYNSGITPAIADGVFDISHKCGGFKTGLIIYGVGDHGGGPTRRDVENGIEMMSWPVFPTIRFGTVREFFKKAEPFRENFPVVDHEINFILSGCYTTQSRIKRGNRRSEQALTDAEFLATFAKEKAGRAIRSAALEQAWQKVLFTHFHDILTGSCVQDSREHAMGLYQDAMAEANAEYTLSMKALSDKIDTSFIATPVDPNAQSDGAGAGYNITPFAGKPVTERGSGRNRIWNIFNPTGTDKTEPVEITVWDWPGDLRFIHLINADGSEVEFQLLDHGQQRYWDHRYFRLLAYVSVRAYSYITIALEPKEENIPVYLSAERNAGQCSNNVLENEFVRCEIDDNTGEIISYIDKKNNKELISSERPAGLVYVDTNIHNGNAWNVGTYFRRESITALSNARRTCGGPLRNAFTYEAKIRSSKITFTYSLDKNAKYVTCKINADWSEVAGDHIPLLIFSLPLAYKTNQFMYDIPGGSIVRSSFDQEQPGLRYAAAICGDSSIGIMTDSKYGYRALENELIATLIHSAHSPDPYPERGIHDISVMIGLFSGCPVEAENMAVSATHPLTYQSTDSHKGELPACGSLFSYEADTAVVSAVYDEDDSLRIRFYSVCDKEGTASVTFDKDIASACCVNLMGETIDAPVSVDGKTAKITIAPKSIATVSVKF